MLTLFFDSTGVIHQEFVKQGTTINTDLWIPILRKFRESMRKKRPVLWRDQNWILLMDNAPAHCSNMAADYYHTVNMDLLSHPPYSPDLAPCDFWIFPELKKTLKGRRFLSLEDLKIEVSNPTGKVP